MASSTALPLVLGRGKIFLAQCLPNQAIHEINGFEYVGNSPSFSLSVEEETLDHYNSDAGLKEKDYTVSLQVNRSGEFTTDHIKPINVARFFLGSTSVITQAAVGAAVVQTLTDVIAGATYVIGRTLANPAGVQGLATVVVASVPAGTTYVAGTDYVVYPALGVIEILSTGAIATGTDISVSYTLTAGTKTRIVSGNTSFEGAMQYRQDNAVGENRTFLFPQVRVRPAGDFNLKGDEWQELTFAVEVLKPASAEAIYIDTELTA